MELTFIQIGHVPDTTYKTMKPSIHSMHLVRRKFIRAATAGMAAACLMLGVKAGHAQNNPVISSVFPDGARLFESSSSLSFNVTSSVGISNITVQLT
ncbi:MAG TPA: hypothetical protein VHA37_00395, partial [Candidatus Saccharimonadales bacterium]|nr:hypothetical protein [Candidatus Saccharimonadales bacterium]